MIRFVENNIPKGSIHYFSKTFVGFGESIYKGVINIDGESGVSLGGWSNPILYAENTNKRVAAMQPFFYLLHFRIFFNPGI